MKNELITDAANGKYMDDVPEVVPRMFGLSHQCWIIDVINVQIKIKKR